MGPASDPMAVVDHRLRVHGVDRLRIIDTSVIPKVIAGTVFFFFLSRTNKMCTALVLLFLSSFLVSNL